MSNRIDFDAIYSVHLDGKYHQPLHLLTTLLGLSSPAPKTSITKNREGEKETKLLTTLEMNDSKSLSLIVFRSRDETFFTKANLAS